MSLFLFYRRKKWHLSRSMGSMSLCFLSTAVRIVLSWLTVCCPLANPLSAHSETGSKRVSKTLDWCVKRNNGILLHSVPFLLVSGGCSPSALHTKLSNISRKQSMEPTKQFVAPMTTINKHIAWYRYRLTKLLITKSPFFIKKKIVNTIYSNFRNKTLVGTKNKPLFDSVLFELRPRCNGHCSFCPASVENDTRVDYTMPLELYKSIIDQLRALNFQGRIAFYVNNDPLLIPNLPEYVRYARKHLADCLLSILTNGRALKEKNGEELLEAGIDELGINWYSDDPQPKLSVGIIRFLENVLQKRYPDQPIQMDGTTHFENNKFRLTISYKKQTEVLLNRAGFSPNKSKMNTPTPLGFCEYPFRQFVITSDGRVAKCCQDFLFSEPIGNLTKENLEEIWFSKKMSYIRSQLINNKRSFSKQCEVCDFIGVKARHLNSPIGIVLSEMYHHEGDG